MQYTVIYAVCHHLLYYYYLLCCVVSSPDTNFNQALDQDLGLEVPAFADSERWYCSEAIGRASNSLVMLVSPPPTY